MTATKKQIPSWQIAMLLCWPLLYQANAFLPYSSGLKRMYDHQYWTAFVTSIMVLHWLSILFAMTCLKKNNWTLSDIGFGLNRLQSLLLFGSYFVLSFALYAWKQKSGPGYSSSPFIPATRAENIYWIFASFSAGFCEEFLYRGFGLSALLSKGMNRWLALLITSVAFLLIHGPGVFHLTFLTIFRFVFGLVMGAFILWKKKLWVTMAIHMWFDFLIVLFAT